jgi:putative methionine-R-sulfoxide reductase with GAF domain
LTDKNKNLLKDKELINYLGDVAVQLSAAMSINELSKILTEIIHTLINVEYTGHYFWDSANNKLKIYDAIGFTEEDKKNAEETVMERHPGWVFRNKKMFHVKDTTKDKSGISVTGKRSFFVRSRLFIPVINKGNAVGCIGFASIEPNYFTSHHISVLSFICNIAGAVY